MILSNTNFNVLYVDPSAGSAGDGGTPATALTSLPASASDLTDCACYIIRRTSASHEVLLPAGENSSVTALAVVGMPKAGDELYALMPVEAQAAWGADAADYANVRSDTREDPYEGESGSLVLPSCLAFFLHRVNLYRDGRSAFETAIQLTNESQGGSIAIERCRFGLKGYELENGANAAAPSYGASMYVQANKPQVFSLRHSAVTTFEDSSYYYEASPWGIYVQSASFADISDVDVWCATGSGYGGMDPRDAALKLGYCSSYDSSYSRYCGNCNIDGVRGHYVQCGSRGSLPPVLHVCANDFTSLRNVALTMADWQFGSGTPSVVSPSGILVDSEGASEYIYENLSATLPKVWNVPNSCGIFKLAGRGASGLPGCAKKIDGISVTLGTDGGIDTESGGNYYYDYQSTETDQWGCYAALWIDIGSNGSWEPVIARNISVTHPRGIALYARNCYVKGASLQGMLRVYSATCDVTGLATWYPGYAVSAANGSTVRIGTLTLGKGNISGSDSDPAVLGTPQENTSFIYVGTSNGALMSDTRSTSTSHDNAYAVICANEQDTGHYTMRTINGMVNTWGVVRSGSSKTASLKLSNSTADGPGFMSLGRQPFGGFSLAATAGLKMLRIHVATKGLTETAEIARRLVAQVSVPQADGSNEMVFSSTRGRWSSEPATWIGEASLTPFLLEIPLNIPADCTVDVKLHYKWYSAGGYLYIDPDMKIEQEE